MSALNGKMISILLILVCMDSFILGTYASKVTHKSRGPLIKKIINTTLAATPFGPYSQAVVVDRTIYISGQLGVNVTSGQLVDGGVGAEAKAALTNIGAILSAAGADFTNVVKTTVILTDINDLGNIDEVYLTFFTSKLPAAATFQVAALPAGALVEFEAIAVLGPLFRKYRPRPVYRKYRPRPSYRKRRPRPHPRRGFSKHFSQ